MEKENARKQTLEQLHERRKQVVRLHKRGIKIMKVVEMPVRTKAKLRAAASEHMTMLKQSPERVMASF